MFDNTTSQSSSPSSHHFLSGGGEMGMLMRTFDWTKTPLGRPDQWPQSLRTTLSILLASRFPMFLFWGPDLICYYNDAYRPSLGKDGKHPHILGMPGHLAWPEIWSIIKPLIDQVLAGGGATYHEDQLVPIYRNGKIEDVYWTFSYSPVVDESSQPAGVFVTCYETTDKIINLRKIQYSEESSRLAVEAAMLGTFDFDAASETMTLSDRTYQIFGHKNERPLYSQLLLQYHPDDLHLREKANLQAAATGAISYEFRIFWPDQSVHSVSLHGKVFFDADRKPVRVIGTVMDITEQKTFLENIQAVEKKFRNTVQQAPVGIVILRGRDFIVESVNDAYLLLVDKTEQDFVNRSLFETLPEVKNSVEPLLTEVFNTGNAYQGIEFPVVINRYGKHELSYFNFVYQALRDEKGVISGVIVVANEVGVSVKARRALEESEKQFRNLVMQAPVAMAIFSGLDFIIDTANDTLLNKIWHRKKEDVIGKKLLDVFPELNGQIFPELLKNVLETGVSYKQNEALAYIITPEGGKNYYLDFEYAPLFETDQTVSAIMVTVHDMTEKVEARQKVEDAEERLRLAAEGTGLATWDLNLQNDSIIYSTRLTEIFGQPASKILTHTDMRDQIHPDDMHLVHEAFENALQTGVYEYEVRVVHPDKTTCWIKTIGTVIFDEHRQPLRMIGTLRDITEQKLVSDTLKSSEEKFRLLADFMPQLIWTGDQAGHLNYYNKAVYDYSGLSFEEIQSDGWIKIVHPDDREDNLTRWARAVATGDDFICEHRFRRYDGEYRWQLSRAVPQKDKDGKVQMWVGTSTDIHEIKELEQQKDFFISMASHELKTPITSIKGYVQILQSLYQNTEDGFLSNSLNIIDKQVGTLTKLISELLDLSKIKAGSLMLSREYFDLNKLARETIDEIVHINPGHEIHFLPETDIVVYADRQRIGQVLTNLLTNAVKYSPNSRLINVNSARENGSTMITVEDFGIGISKTDQQKIFDRFYRVAGKDEKTFPGFGIGLFIASEIIRRHQGEIGVDSKPGKGSVFYFSLPNHEP